MPCTSVRRLVGSGRAVVLALAGLLTATSAVVGVPGFVGPARAASGFYIRGGGNGHGVGMGQYGALGYAQHGWSYQQILAHYYTGTALGTINPRRTVTVLLGTGAASFSGASVAGGASLAGRRAPVAACPPAGGGTSTTPTGTTPASPVTTPTTTSPTTTSPPATTPTSTSPTTTSPTTSTPTGSGTSGGAGVGAGSAGSGGGGCAAATAGGRSQSAPTRALNPSTTYTVTPGRAGGLTLLAGGKAIGTFPAPLAVRGRGPLLAAGYGRYRGALEFWPAGGSVQIVNALDVEDYVRGVIGGEMPPSWPAAALQAQAVAARTYVITVNPAGAHFEVYPDTRSQMYRGVAAETGSTDAAVAATSGQVVTYHGKPVVTYFFSSSGGYTESISDAWPGTPSEPWLVGVPDPFDGAGQNPFHRWSFNLTIARASADLGGLVRGSLIGIRPITDGASPRVVTAAVVGTGGQSSATGVQLQQAFHLMSTYVSFTTITALPGPGGSGSDGSGSGGSGSGGSGSDGSGSGGSGSGGSGSGGSGTGGTGTGGSGTGGSGASTGSGTRSTPAPSPTAGASAGVSLHGTIFPSSRGGVVVIQQLVSGGYRPVATAKLAGNGAYVATIPSAGRYRVVYDGIVGPAINVGG